MEWAACIAEWGVGPTLLEEACKSMPVHPFFESSTMLATLFEHLTITSHAATNAPSAHVVSLEQHVCLSPFQQLVEELRHIVPLPAQDAEHDWLDNDHRSLIHRGTLHSQFTTQLDTIPKWHHSIVEHLQVQEVMVFTDGSATTGEADILPCSWAFSVWVQTQQGIYFYGGASGQAAPPETPYHVGEFGDHALTAELLALSWGLIWASEFAPFFRLLGLLLRCGVSRSERLWRVETDCVSGRAGSSILASSSHCCQTICGPSMHSWLRTCQGPLGGSRQ